MTCKLGSKFVCIDIYLGVVTSDNNFMQFITVELTKYHHHLSLFALIHGRNKEKVFVELSTTSRQGYKAHLKSNL